MTPPDWEAARKRFLESTSEEEREALCGLGDRLSQFRLERGRPMPDAEFKEFLAALEELRRVLEELVSQQPSEKLNPE
jgi:hypothetical protein